MNRRLSFIPIPERSNKPRENGITIVRDYHIGYNQAVDLVESMGQFIDYVKLRHLFVLTAENTENDLMLRKIKLYRDNQMEVFPGGIVFEMAWLNGLVDRTFAKLFEMGCSAVECSENIIPLTLEEKIKYTKMATSCGLKVLFEIGEKYPEDYLDLDIAIKEINELLEAGVKKVILERSQIEICLGKKGESPEAWRLEKLVQTVGLANIIFEAEAKAHQVWLFKTFGPDVNLGPNLEPEYIAKLEATRRSLSREGGYTYMVDKLKKIANPAFSE